MPYTLFNKTNVLAVLTLFLVAACESGPTEAEITACKNRFRDRSVFQPRDMTYSGYSSGVIFLKYQGPRTGKKWDLRCYDGKTEFSVPGRNVWFPLK